MDKFFKVQFYTVFQYQYKIYVMKVWISYILKMYTKVWLGFIFKCTKIALRILASLQSRGLYEQGQVEVEEDKKH